LSRAKNARNFRRVPLFCPLLRLVILGFVLGMTSFAQAQAPPATMPPNTVYGRLGAGQSGPGQAIPFATLSAQLFPAIVRSGRIIETSNVVMYVNGNPSGTATCGPAGASTCSAGVDAGYCGTPATACQTLQYAVGVMIGNIDFAYVYAGNIYLAHNAGTANYDLELVNGPWVGTGVINVIGDSSSPTATVVTIPPNGNAIQCKDLCTLYIQHFAIADNGTNNGANGIIVGASGNAGHVDLNDITFQACAACIQMTAGNLGSVIFVGPVTIAGGAAIAMDASDGGMIDTAGQTITVSGTPSFSTAFAYLPNGGLIKATPSTFSGSATGLRCIVSGPLNLNGYDPNNIFPGNSNCVQNENVGAIGIQNGTTFGYGTSGYALLSGGGATSKDTWSNTLTSYSLVSPAISNPTLSGSINVTGQIIPAYGTPTITSGACGTTTNGTIAAGGTNQSGEVVIASATTTSCAISFSATLSAAPLACILFPENATAAATGTTVARISAISTGGFTITGSALASANYYYHCF
jgi:hypothetical protein